MSRWIEHAWKVQILRKLSIQKALKLSIQKAMKLSIQKAMKTIDTESYEKLYNFQD